MPLAVDGSLDRPNGRLIVISHGSPGTPWVHFDLATVLVEAGYVVAMPVHDGDNVGDSGKLGVPSWKRRPQEVSAAIDRLQNDARFQGKLDFARVGLYGMSAGGLTALVLAGGQWSPARLQTHCEKAIQDDFHACAGPSFSLNGGILDRLKISMVQFVIRWKWRDATQYGHVDSRITAIVSAVPFAANFDLESLRNPRSALAIVSARKDRWLVPRYHSDALLAACLSCVHLLDIETGGHGALLGPLPAAALTEGSLIGDPPGFDRAVEVLRINATIAGWFNQQLLPAR